MLWQCSAWGFPALLLAFVLALRLVGERSWLIVPWLYLPRTPLVMPLALLTAIALFRRSWSGLCAQAIAAWLLAFPLLGLELRACVRAPAKTGIAIFSQNVFFGRLGADKIAATVPQDIDVVVLQAVGQSGILRAPRFAGWSVHSSYHFAVASRFPILEIGTDAPDPQRPRAAYERYRLATPIGRIDLYNVHTSSPRTAFFHERNRWNLWSAIASGDLAGNIEWNTNLRSREVLALTADVARSRVPVIIAGDLNLPGLSRIFSERFGGFRDGQVEAGCGFGYTYPSHRLFPWMRIDRVLASPQLGFVDFRVGRAGGSDHRPVTARLSVASDERS